MFNKLHKVVTQELLDRVQSGEATTADIKAACDWLKSNDITGIALPKNSLGKLANIIPDIDPELVRSRVSRY
jgi:hypothetical protein